MNANPAVIYAVDKNDLLIHVNGEWIKFLEENEGAVSVFPPHVIGRPIWEFVRGEGLAQIYQKLLQNVRTTGKSFQFNYRCDSPSLKRFMTMAISPLDDGAVRFVSHTKEIVPQDRPLKVVAAFTGNQHARRCSVCNNFKVNETDWSETLDSEFLNNVMNQDREIKVLWSVCPSCASQLDLDDRSFRSSASVTELEGE